MRKDRLDMPGFFLLLFLAMIFAGNQVITKYANQGLQPVFFAGARSFLAFFSVLGWMIWRGQPPRYSRGIWPYGVLIGLLFAGEFLSLFMALDLTSVSRASIIFYSMPVWLAIAAHFFIAGERLNITRIMGLALAFAGTAMAILSREGAGSQSSLAGDLFALLGAFCWAATAFMARKPPINRLPPETQLLWMVGISAPILLLAAPAFGPLLRDIQPIHWVILIYHASIVVAGCFVLWFWLLARYPTGAVAGFSFLTPIFGLFFGWLAYGDPLTPTIITATALVAVGIILINRR